MWCLECHRIADKRQTRVAFAETTTMEWHQIPSHAAHLVAQMIAQKCWNSREFDRNHEY
jgi:hypothetical protein